MHVQQMESKFHHVRTDYEALQVLFDEAQSQIVDDREGYDQTSKWRLLVCMCLVGH